MGDYVAKILQNGLSSLAEYSSHFDSLEFVILETGLGVDAHDVDRLAQILRDVFGVEVHHRTCEESHTVMLQAKANFGRSLPGMKGLLSPYWCFVQPRLSHHIEAVDAEFWWVLTSWK